MNKKFEEKVGTEIKRKETSGKLVDYLAKKLLATHSTGSISYLLFVLVCKHNFSWVVISMHAQMKHIL